MAGTLGYAEHEECGLRQKKLKQIQAGVHGAEVYDCDFTLPKRGDRTH